MRRAAWRQTPWQAICRRCSWVRRRRGAGEAASVGAGLAHQAHGAIGFTQEYELHYLTRRLWSWRDEFGNEAEWNAVVGRAALAAGADGLWPALTAAPPPSANIEGA